MLLAGLVFRFFFNDTATTEIYTLSLHDALPIWKGGAEIVGLLKTGSAYYAPSSAAAEMVDAVLKDKHKILPCCCYLEGEFGIKGLYVGVPTQLGAKGVEKIWEIKLTEDEDAALQKSAAAVKELVDMLKL